MIKINLMQDRYQFEYYHKYYTSDNTYVIIEIWFVYKNDDNRELRKIMRKNIMCVHYKI